jgi:hypothetical protein
MILTPAYDGSCRTSSIYIKLEARVRRAEKASANRSFRRALKHKLNDMKTGRSDWESEDFGDLPRYTSWDIW